MTPFAGNRVAVLGLGLAGLPAAMRLREWGAEVTCWDDRDTTAASAAGLRVAPLLPFAFDALLLSPGIPHALPAPHPVAAAARAAGAPILADVEFLFRAVRAAGSQARFVGITGTNGKSTTTALLGHILAVAGVPAQVGGNLGPPALAMPILGDDGVYVLEMSSYMTERLATLRFDVAALLNLTPDHLDRHGDMAGYLAAKAGIFDRQGSADVAVLGDVALDLPAGVLRLADLPAPDLTGCPGLPGAHNAQNAAAACAMARALGVAEAVLPVALASFPGLPHRQEVVGERRGVRFVNDSKATNAESTAHALASYRRIRWIAGGTGKEGGIAPLARHFGRVAHAYLIGRDGPAFAETLAAHGVPHSIPGTLEAATRAAAAAALPGEVVLLSPAAASWDQFTGFDARGDAFRALVHAMEPS